MYKYCRVIVLSTLLFFSSLHSITGMPQSEDNPPSFDIASPESYCIEGVPYVSQETVLYCMFACPSMVLQYYGINVTLYDVLYHLGAGYAMGYSTPYMPRTPEGCGMVTRWDVDCIFLGNLFGVEYERWQADLAFSEQNAWSQYWVRVQQNLSQNIPVMTNIDPSYLPSISQPLRSGLGFPEQGLLQCSDTLWHLAPCNILHQILLVGYNTTNGTICYHDPASALWGHPEMGTYTWMNLTLFRQALWRLSTYRSFSYYIEIFANTTDPPLRRDEAFYYAHERNLNKMRGERSAYDTYITDIWDCTDLGLNAVKALQHHLDPGIMNRVTTMYMYKATALSSLLSIRYQLHSLLNFTFPTIVNNDEYQSLVNHFQQIAIEKRDMAGYLKDLQYYLENNTLIELCNHDAMLLQEEAEKWRELASLFEVFLRRGSLMSLVYGLAIIQEMEKICEDVIQLEKQILII